jgi:hypothetical protein
MKKYSLMLCLLATPVLADGAITITGTNSSWFNYSNQQYAESMATARSSETRYSTSYSAEAYAQMQAAIKKAEAEARAKYCLAMNIKCD